MPRIFIALAATKRIVISEGFQNHHQYFAREVIGVVSVAKVESSCSRITKIKIINEDRFQFSDTNSSEHYPEETSIPVYTLNHLPGFQDLRGPFASKV